MVGPSKSWASLARQARLSAAYSRGSARNRSSDELPPSPRRATPTCLIRHRAFTGRKPPFVQVQTRNCLGRMAPRLTEDVIPNRFHGAETH